MAVTMDAGTPGVKKKSRQQLIKEEIQRKKQANKARWDSRMYRAGGDKKAAYMNLAALPPKTKKGNAKSSVQQERVEAATPKGTFKPKPSAAPKTEPSKEPTRKTPLHGDDIPVSVWDEYYAKQKQKVQRRRLEMQNPREPVDSEASRRPVSQRGVASQKSRDSQKEDTVQRIYGAFSGRPRRMVTK